MPVASAQVKILPVYWPDYTRWRHVSHRACAHAYHTRAQSLEGFGIMCNFAMTDPSSLFQRGGNAGACNMTCRPTFRPGFFLVAGSIALPLTYIAPRRYDPTRSVINILRLMGASHDVSNDSARCGRAARQMFACVTPHFKGIDIPEDVPLAIRRVSASCLSLLTSPKGPHHTAWRGRTGV